MLVVPTDLQPVVLVWVMGQNLVLLSNAGGWQNHACRSHLAPQTVDSWCVLAHPAPDFASMLLLLSVQTPWCCPCMHVQEVLLRGF